MLNAILIIIAPTFATAETLAAARRSEREWHWFPSQNAAITWIARCKEFGLVFDLQWIEYEDEWEHPDRVMRRERYGDP
jgi:hypothetical protein